MKKKLKLSVVHLLQRTNSPKANTTVSIKSHIPTCFTPQSNSITFQDMYKQAIGQCKKQESLKQSKAEKVKKMTPVYSKRPKRQSFTKTANTLSSNITSLASSRKKTTSSIETQQLDYDCNKQNLQENLKRNENDEEKVQENNQRVQTTLERFRKCEQSLNHQNHSHIRQNNECFLTERQIDSMMLQMGYNIRHSKYVKFLSLLEVDEYGGVPSQNLCKVLEAIEKKDQSYVTMIESLPEIKIIDHNLKVLISNEQGEIMRNYFSDFRQTNPLFSRKGQRLGKNSKNKSSPKQTSFVSPSGKKTNKTSEQKLSMIGCQKQQRNGKQEIKVNEFNDYMEDSCDANTFRQFQNLNVQCESQQNTFSNQLSRCSSVKSQKGLEIVPIENEALKGQFEEKNCSRLCQNQSPFQNGKKPILSIDVNIGEGLSQKILVYEGESAKEVSQRLASKFAITEETKMKFYKFLDSHLSTVLWKIDELSQEMMTDRDIE